MDSPTVVAGACRQVGSQIPHWTQGAGGNLSLKDERWLYIKASGFRLDGVTPEKGVSRVDREKLLALLEKCRTEEEYSDALSQSRAPESPRPSMEAGFHAVLPGKWVIHFHSLAAVLMCHEWASQRARFDAWARGKMKCRVL